MAKQQLKIGLKFKQKNNYGITYKVMTIDSEKNSVTVKVKDSTGTMELKWRMDDVLYFLSTGEYEIINERPNVSKNGQFENEGAYAE